MLAKSFASLNNEVQDKLSIDIKVPVQLGVMSRCPDALLCEGVFDRVLPNVTAKVDFSLIYVANIDESEPTFGVRCLHGHKECAGNVQQLCVSRHAAFQTWWSFLRCQNAAGKENIVGAGSSASGEAPEGVAMLQESAKLSHQLGIRKSCTVLINQKPVCVHDGGWKDCKNGHKSEDFVRQIEDEYERLNQGTM